MIRKIITIKISLFFMLLTACNENFGVSAGEEKKPADLAQNGKKDTKKQEKPAKTEAEKKEIMKTCSEIQDEQPCNNNEDCKFYIVCMSKDKVLEIENDKDLQAKLADAEKEASLVVYQKFDNPHKRVMYRNLGKTDEYSLKNKYENLVIQLQKVLSLPFGMIHDQANLGFDLLKKRDEAYDALISKIKENNQKIREESDAYRAREESREAERQRATEEKRKREKAAEEERERPIREQRQREQTERERKNQAKNEELLKQIRLKEEQEKRAEDERKRLELEKEQLALKVKNFMEKNIFEEYANEDSLNQNIALLNAEQKKQLIEKIKNISYVETLKNFSVNLFTKISPSEYSLQLFEALVNNKNFKEYYAKNAYSSIHTLVNIDIYKMVNQQIDNKYKKELLTAILKNPIFNNLEFGHSLDNINQMSYEKLLGIMNTVEDKKYIYDYLEKTINEDTISHVLFKINNSKKEIYENLEAIYKNNFVKNKFSEFDYSIKDILSTVAYDDKIKDKLKIVKLILDNYLVGGDLFLDNGYPHNGSVGKFRLKNVLSASKDKGKDTGIIEYLKNKSSENEKNKLIDLATNKDTYYEFEAKYKDMLKQVLTDAGIIKS